MAGRLEVSESWLSRYLTLARLPAEVVEAYGSIRDVTEVHARRLKPLLAKEDSREKILTVARQLADEKAAGARKEGSEVLAELLAAAKPAAARPAERVYGESLETGIRVRTNGKSVKIEFYKNLPRAELMAAFETFVRDRFDEH